MTPARLRKKDQDRTNRGPAKSLWREYGEALLIALILALVIRAFFFQAFSIPSGSMQPTLLIGDYLLVNKLSYGIRNPLTNRIWISIGKPHRGDVVVFIFPQDPSKDYIKRVVGLPGDKVEIRNKQVFINGNAVQSARAVYTDDTDIPLGQSPRDNLAPMTVPDNAYFVMGDNRDHSYDSRFWGFVPDDALRGKAFVIYFSWQGQQGTSFFPSLLGGLKGLILHFSWDTESFRLRWDRLGTLIK
jgi:signal peptidase I